MRRYFIGIGSNVNPESHYPLILGELLKLSPVLNLSRVIETQAVGLQEGSNPRFLNGAAAFISEMNETTLKQHLNQIEINLGRDRNAADSKFINRTADLDISFWIPADATHVQAEDIPAEPYMRPQTIELITYLGLSCDEPLNTLPRGVALKYHIYSFGMRTVTLERT